MTDRQTRVALSLPAHNAYWRETAEETLSKYVAENPDVTASDLTTFADTTDPHNGCNEFDDSRQRHKQAQARLWARCIALYKETGEASTPLNLYTRTAA